MSESAALRSPSCIRVAMLIQRYYPHVGGAEQQLAALAPRLRALGVEMTVITRRLPGLAAFEQINGVPVYRLPVPGPKPVASAAFTASALPLLRRLRPQVIHAHELLSPATTALAAKRLFKTPVVAKVLRGGELGDVAKLKHKPLGKGRLERLRDQVDAFIVISREIDAELAEIGVPAARRVFIPNGVDTARFAPVPTAEKSALRASLGLPDDALIAVFAGRLVPEKRLHHVVGMWAAVRAKQPDALLLLVGTGEQEADLKQMAGDGVRFTGAVGDVSPYLKAADLFLLPSATEGLSNAMLEAMAAGLPVLATAVGGAPDLIAHGNSGWLIPPDDVPALQAALEHLLGDASLRTWLGEQGRARVMDEYALDTTAARLRALYEQVTASH